MIPYSSLEELTPESLTQMWEVAAEAFRADDVASGVAVYQQMMDLAPEFEHTPENLKKWLLLFVARVLLAGELREAGCWEEAEHWAKEAARHPNVAFEAELVLGGCYGDNGDFEQATLHYLSALAKRPLKKAYAWALLGYALCHTGHKEESEFCYHTALQLDPDFDEAHFNLGVSARENGEYAEAAVCFRRTLELSPDYDRAHAELGRLLLEFGQLEEAKDHLQRAMALDPDEVRAHIYLAQWYWASENLDKAKEHYVAAVELRPDWVTSNLLYAHFLDCALEDTALAERHYEIALKREPLDSVVLFIFAAFLKRAGRTTESSELESRMRTVGEDMARSYQDGVLPKGTCR